MDKMLLQSTIIAEFQKFLSDDEVQQVLDLLDSYCCACWRHEDVACDCDITVDDSEVTSPLTEIVNTSTGSANGLIWTVSANFENKEDADDEDTD